MSNPDYSCSEENHDTVSIRDELGGAKAQRRTASMTFWVLGDRLKLFTGYVLQNLGLQVASRYRPIAFDPEGSSLDRCLTVNNTG
jgi:hypothetical protein